ncbi:hypothetical protein DFH08DRAFT_810065 [Mycena albidolilacea]|uniref:Uncharacterized protein n=1 Tax=Mycena albidolilacea TaxID=1033008 RepID=A0AAD6ZYV4_9AGAR|nr:hypothetical protein DFH08DRAFT_810065 [Mycena albidolilacea]
MHTPIFFGSDKTTVSVATGDVEYHSASISLGSPDNSMRRAHHNVVMLFTFLAIPKNCPEQVMLAGIVQNWCAKYSRDIVVRPPPSGHQGIIQGPSRHLGRRQGATNFFRNTFSEHKTSINTAPKTETSEKRVNNAIRRVWDTNTASNGNQGAVTNRLQNEVASGKSVQETRVGVD